MFCNEKYQLQLNAYKFLSFKLSGYNSFVSLHHHMNKNEIQDRFLKNEIYIQKFCFYYEYLLCIFSLHNSKHLLLVVLTKNVDFQNPKKQGVTQYHITCLHHVEQQGVVGQPLAGSLGQRMQAAKHRQEPFSQMQLVLKQS